MLRLLLATAIVCNGVLAATASAESPFKVGFVYVGPVGDHGGTYQHDQGRLAVEERFGDTVETTYVERLRRAGAERVIGQLAAEGHDMVFTTSFGFMNPTAKVAAQFPEVTFEHATGYKRADNLSTYLSVTYLSVTYLSVTYQGRYVSGFLAAHMSETGVVGYIASFPIPEVIRDINAVMLGMQRVRPDMELKIVWVSTWFDPGKEADAARVLIDQGADVLIQHTDSPAAMQVAEERGIYAVGQASDMSTFGPNAHLTAVVNDWSPYYIRRVQEVMDGTWVPGDFWGGMAEDVIQITPLNAAVPGDVAAEAKALIDGIKDGSVHPFTGRIRAQSGEEVIPAGRHMTNEELAAMDWYVEGIEGTIPQ